MREEEKLTFAAGHTITVAVNHSFFFLFAYKLSGLLKETSSPGINTEEEYDLLS